MAKEIQNNQCDAGSLEPQRVVDSLLKDDRTAIDCFRQEYNKLTDSDKVKYIDDLHKKVVYGEAPSTDGDPNKVRDITMRPIFDKEGKVADLDMATYNRDKNSYFKGRWDTDKTDLKTYDIYNSGTAAGKEIQDANALQAKVAPYVRGFYAMRDETALTGEGLTNWDKFKRGVESTLTKAHRYKSDVYLPLNADQNKQVFDNYYNTIQKSVPPGTFDMAMLNELKKQTIERPVGGLSNELASNKFGLNSPYRAHIGNYYDANYSQKLPSALETTVDAARKHYQEFWLNKKYS